MKVAQRGLIFFIFLYVCFNGGLVGPQRTQPHLSLAGTFSSLSGSQDLQYRSVDHRPRYTPKKNIPHDMMPSQKAICLFCCMPFFIGTPNQEFRRVGGMSDLESGMTSSSLYLIGYWEPQKTQSNHRVMWQHLANR